MHACDTATDEALARAVRWEAPVILAAPCCHHDIQTQLSQAEVPDPYTMITRHGILRERFADVLTDALRASILRQYGYRVEAIQFVGSEHTPRNVLLRAIRTGAESGANVGEEYAAMVAQWGYARPWQNARDARRPCPRTTSSGTAPCWRWLNIHRCPPDPPRGRWCRGQRLRPRTGSWLPRLGTVEVGADVVDLDEYSADEVRRVEPATRRLAGLGMPCGDSGTALAQPGQVDHPVVEPELGVADRAVVTRQPGLLSEPERTGEEVDGGHAVLVRKERNDRGLAPSSAFPVRLVGLRMRSAPSTRFDCWRLVAF